MNLDGSTSRANANTRHAAMSNCATAGPIKKYFQDTIAILMQLRKNLGGHFKSGQRWSPQNRPTGLTQDKNLFYPAGCCLGKVTSKNL
jgi:hypothetical protein